MPRIAIVDDEPHYAKDLAERLKATGIENCDVLMNLRNLDAMLRENAYDAIIVDWEFHGVTRGPDIVHKIRGVQPNAQIIVHSKHAYLSENSKRFGADIFLVKGISDDDLTTTVHDIVERTRAPRLIEIPGLAAITTVSKDFSRLMANVADGCDDLFRVTPREFEEFIAELWHRLGYTVTLTAATRDGGFDIAAVRGGEAGIRFLIECKRYAASRSVDVSVVRALHGVVTDQGATKGILATTTRITEPARNYLDMHRWQLEGRDYEGIVAWAKAARQHQK